MTHGARAFLFGLAALTAACTAFEDDPAAEPDGAPGTGCGGSLCDGSLPEQSLADASVPDVSVADASLADAPIADGPLLDASLSDTSPQTSAPDGASCACPYSACVDGGCAPVCGDANFGTGALLPDGGLAGLAADLSEPGVEDDMLAVSADGKVLHARFNAWQSARCAIQVVTDDQADHMLLSVPSAGGVYLTADLSTQAAFAGLNPGRGTITADGQHLILQTYCNTGFRYATLTGFQVGTPDQGPFVDVNASIPGGGDVESPVISNDGLTFLYAVRDAPQPADNGVYVATRSQASALFVPQGKAPDALQPFWYANAISSDNLTLFMEVDWGMFPLTRTSVGQPWTIPPSFVTDAGLVSPTPHYFSPKPTPDCSRIFVSCGSQPGGWNQDICVLPRLP